MNFQSRLVLSAISLLLCAVPCSVAAEADSDCKVKVGDTAPEFAAVTTDNAPVSLSSYKGKVLLVNLFATWCPPCRKELPFVEKDVWQKYKSQGLAVLVVGREHTKVEIKEFKTRQKLTVPMAGDPKREVFNKFAERGIPRNFLIGKNGKVVFTSVGFSDADFAELKRCIERELAKPAV